MISKTLPQTFALYTAQYIQLFKICTYYKLNHQYTILFDTLSNITFPNASLNMN